MNWIPVGASLFASNIGSGHFVGLAGSGAASGIAISSFELNAAFVLLLLGWVFVPVYVAAGVYTMPEYLRKRFGGQRIRVYLSVLALLLYVFTKISADLYAGYIFINQSMNINLYLSIVILLLIAAAFTIAGGLTAVMWTDFIQTIIMIAGAIVLMILGFIEIGGYNKMVKGYMAAVPNTTLYANDSSPFKSCGVPPSTAMNLVRPYDDPTGLPWPGIFFGLTISAVWYWCSDQVIVQRALSAKNLSHAKAGCILASYLKFLPLFLIVFPGMIARALYKDEVGCAEPSVCEEFCGQANGCTNTAYPLLVIRIMPNGLRGLMLAVMMSALMSSLTSIFNSSSTIFTMDIWRLIRRNSSDVELMIVGRCFVLVLVGVSVAWIPVVQGVPELFHYIQAITSFLAPPICAVYVLAISWKRINEQGAFWSLMIGLLVGMIRFIAQYSYGTQPPCGVPNDNPIPAVIARVHYLHFGIILFTIVAISAIVISLLTKPLDERMLVRLTFCDRHNQEERLDVSEIDEEAKRHYDNTAFTDSSNAVNRGGRSMELTDLNSVENTVDESRSKPTTGVASTVDGSTEIKWYRRMFNWLCGIENMTESEDVPEDLDTSLYQAPFWSRVLNINAVLLLAATIFIWVFYG